MLISIEQQKELLILAKKAAEKAGRFIVSSTDEQRQVQSKEGGASLASQVVTSVDLKAQEIILDELKESFQTYDLGLLTEELAEDGSRFQKSCFWCIDPLDGTLPFIEQTKGYSVSIALVNQKGVALLGVIYDPTTHTTYSAMKNHGAYRNDLAFHVNGREEDHVFTIVADRSDIKKGTIRFAQTAVKNTFPDTTIEIIGTGGAAMNAMWMLENHPAVYQKCPKPEQGGGSIWDFAASSVIVSEAGGWCSNYNQEPLFLNNEKSTFMNEDGVLMLSSQKVARRYLGTSE